MKSSDQVPFTQWADIHRTERFISAEPLSGYSLVHRDDEGCIFYLSPEASADELGQALLEALGRSRFVLPRADPLQWEKYERHEQNWQKDFMRRYGYKTRREAYQTMDWVRTERSEGKVSFEPHKRGKPGHWISLTADERVVVPATMDAAVAGAALRLALIRCE